MESLDSVAKALDESLAQLTQDAAGSFQLQLEQYLDSSDSQVQVAAIQAVHEILLNGSEDHKTVIYENAAMSLLPVLIPIHSGTSCSPFSSSTEPTAELIQLISTHSPAKEVILSLTDCLTPIEDAAVEAQYGDLGSDDDDDGDEEMVAEGRRRHSTDSGVIDPVSGLSVVLKSYTAALARMKTDRSTPTLLSISDSLIDTFTVVTPLITDPTPAMEILRHLCEFVKVAWAWVQETSDKGGEQRAMLMNILFMGITLLSPRLGARQFERMFIHQHPRYNALHPLQAQDHWRSGQEVSQLCLATAQSLSISSSDLLERLIRPSSTSPYSALAALSLLVSSLPGVHDPSTISSNTAPTGTSTSGDYESSTAAERTAGAFTDINVTPHLLGDCMPVLSAALTADAPDAGLAWLWHLVNQGTASVSFDSASMLLELLVPLASSAPSPTSRMATLKLIGTLIATAKDPKSQAKLYLQLAEPENPFEGLRVESLSLLREAISKPSVSTSTTNQLLTHISILTPTLFTLPTSSTPPTISAFARPTVPLDANTSTDRPPLDLPLDILAGTMYPSWFVECLNLLRLILTLDITNVSGMRDPMTLQRVYGGWVVPQLKRLKVLRTQAREAAVSSRTPAERVEDDEDAKHGHGHGMGSQVDFLLDRWEDALERVKDVIRPIVGEEKMDPDLYPLQGQHNTAAGGGTLESTLETVEE